jgi:hypothetical protein
MSDPSKRPVWAWEDILPLLLVPASSVAAWFLPAPYIHYLFSLLAVGLLFDLLSFACHVSTLVTGKFRSGLPLVGLFLYVWFVLAYPRSLVAPQQAEVLRVLLYKPLDLLVLAGVHLLFQLPMFFHGPRDRYR